MSAGFLYVLINPSMPGMAKVGKTTRDPSDRVGELSGATGVATPFILAYQQPVPDCHTAEAWVHAQLELKGQRVASNREFFNAPLHEIVALVSQAVNVAPASGNSVSTTETAMAEKTVAEELVALGLTYWHGDGVIENGSTALKYFSQASAIGDSTGSLYAGMCLHLGVAGLRVDLERAIDFYRKAIAQGDWLGHRYAAMAFIKADNPQNAAREFLTLFEKATAIANKNSMERRYIGDVLPGSACEYLRQVAVESIPHVVPNAQILPFRSEIVAWLEQERKEGRHVGQNALALQFLQKLV